MCGKVSVLHIKGDEYEKFLTETFLRTTRRSIMEAIRRSQLCRLSGESNNGECDDLFNRNEKA